jgi:hypothetical protein
MTTVLIFFGRLLAGVGILIASLGGLLLALGCLICALPIITVLGALTWIALGDIL